MSESAPAATPAATPPSTPAAAPPVAATPPPGEAPKPVEIPQELLKREREIRAQQQQVAKEREEFAKQRQEYDAWKASQAKAADDSADPLEQLKRTRETVAQLNKRLDDERQAAQNAEGQRILNEWRRERVKEVEAAGDKYELTLLAGRASEVPALIQRHYVEFGRQNGRNPEQDEMMTVEQAASQIEAEELARAEKLTASKKWKAKTAPPVEAPPAPAGEGAPGRDAPKAPATLTNALTGTTAAVTPSGKKLSAEERMRRALTLPIPGKKATV